MNKDELLKQSMELNKKLIEKMSNEMYDFIKEFIHLEDEYKDVKAKDDEKPSLMDTIRTERDMTAGPLDEDGPPDNMTPVSEPKEKEKPKKEPKQPLF